MECGTCTACCTLLPIDPIGKPVNTPCQFCTGKGCFIHDSKPETCTEFECAYYQCQNLPITLRPDNSGIIFFKKTDKIFVAAIVDKAEVTELARRQVSSFNHEGYSVIILGINKRPHVTLAEGHNSDDIMREYTGTLYGNI